MEFQHMINRTGRVRNRLLTWVTGTKFNPKRLRGILLGLIVNIALGEVCCYRLVNQDIRAGELPSYTADLMIIIFAVFEAVLSPLVSWWGYSKRRKLLIGYGTAVVVCCFSWFLMPAKLERQESELCDAANSENNIGFTGTSTSTVFRLLIIIYTCTVFVLARVVCITHGIAYCDDYAPARTSVHYGVLLISRIFPLVLGHKVLTDAVENNMTLQVVALSMGSLSSLIQLPCAISSGPPEINGMQLEGVPLTDRGLRTSISRILSNPIVLTQIFSMGLVTASLWGYGYYEIEIIKVKFNLIPGSSVYLLLCEIFFFAFIAVAVAYAGTLFSAPIHLTFYKLSAIKKSALMSLLMFVFYILIITVPHCDTGNITGVGKNYYGHPECSLACNCKPQWDEFKPVCAVDSMVGYISPCQAGCRESQKLNGVQVYSNCTCAGGGHVLEHACGDEPCRKAHLLHGLMYNMLVAFAILVLQAQGVLLINAVDPRDKSVVLGLASSFVAIMTFVVGHSIFYGLYVGTCRWYEGDKCHLQSQAFPYLVGATCAFLMLTSIFSTVASWHFHKLLDKSTDEVFDSRL